MGEEGCIHGFVWGDLMEGNHLEDLIIDGNIILEWMGCGGMDWIEQAQDRDSWWALVNAVMNFRVPQNEGNFLTS